MLRHATSQPGSTPRTTQPPTHIRHLTRRRMFRSVNSPLGKYTTSSCPQNQGVLQAGGNPQLHTSTCLQHPQFNNTHKQPYQPKQWPGSSAVHQTKQQQNFVLLGWFGLSLGQGMPKVHEPHRPAADQSRGLTVTCSTHQDMQYAVVKWPNHQALSAAHVPICP